MTHHNIECMDLQVGQLKQVTELLATDSNVANGHKNRSLQLRTLGQSVPGQMLTAGHWLVALCLLLICFLPTQSTA